MRLSIRAIAGTLALAVLGGSTQTRAQNEDRQTTPSAIPAGARIAVVSQNSSGGNQVDRIVGDMLITALRKSGVRVIERQAVDAIAREQQLVREGIVDPATAVPAGKVLGVDILLNVKATEFGIKDDRVGGVIALGPVAGLQVRTSTARVVLDARLLDVKTGTVLTASTAEGKQVHHGGTVVGGFIDRRIINVGAIDIGSKEWSESSLGKAARKTVDALVKKLAGVVNVGDGSVLAVTTGGEVIVTLGSFDRIRVGDRLDVVRLEPITDSKGSVVWSSERVIGELRITEVRGDRAKAVSVERGLTVAEGDLVRKQQLRIRSSQPEEPR